MMGLIESGPAALSGSKDFTASSSRLGSYILSTRVFGGSTWVCEVLLVDAGSSLKSVSSITSKVLVALLVSVSSVL